MLTLSVIKDNNIPLRIQNMLYLNICISMHIITLSKYNGSLKWEYQKIDNINHTQRSKSHKSNDKNSINSLRIEFLSPPPIRDSYHISRTLKLASFSVVHDNKMSYMVISLIIYHAFIMFSLTLCAGICGCILATRT